MEWLSENVTATIVSKVPCETDVPCSFFSVRDERNLCSQPHFLSCMRKLRQHLSRETPLPVLETKRHFLFRGNSLRQLRSKKNFSMSATPLSSADVSPKTPTKTYRLKVSKCCLICNLNLTANMVSHREERARNLCLAGY